MVIEPKSKFITDISPESQVFLGPNHDAFTVKQFSPYRKRYLLNLESINTRNDAEEFRDSILYLSFEDRDPLPEGEYYDWQLLGMKVIADEEPLGKLEEIIETGANDVYVVRTESGDEVLLPAIDSVIKVVDLENNHMIVHLLPGLIP
jgi:16S rRNA processing protein RimM